MPFIIRPGTAADAPAAYQLICELAQYEKALEEVALSLEEFVKDGFGSNPPAYQLRVADEYDDQHQLLGVVGMALFYISYSTWKGRVVYLDDLVVTERHRRSGIGKLLLQSVMDFARAEQVRQVRWHVLDWNEPAIRFYKKINARLEDNWITCKVTDMNTLQS